MNPPKDWSNRSAWDRYYQAKEFCLQKVLTYELKDALSYFQAVRHSQDRKVWFVGCGMELGPWLFAHLGCKVTATDISEVAIGFQRQLLQKNPFEELQELAQLLQEEKIEQEPLFIHPRLEAHDFTLPLQDEKFDVILNRRAIQGLALPTLEKATQRFCEATKAGGMLICDTMNVQGQRRTDLENSLAKAGYLIFNLKANQWLRQKLDETGILYVMVLGNPMIPQWDQYKAKGGEEQAKKDREILRSFRDEYVKRLELNQQEDKEVYREGLSKVAYLIYNTG